MGLVWSWSWYEVCFASVFEFLLSAERTAFLLSLTYIDKTFIVIGIGWWYECSTGSKSLLFGEWITTTLNWWDEHGFGEIIWRLGAAVLMWWYYECRGVVNRGALVKRCVDLEVEWLRGECCTWSKLLFIWQ